MKPAGFWVRFAASLIDAILLNGLLWLVNLAVLGAMYGVYALLASRGGATIKPFNEAFEGLFEQVVDAVLSLVIWAPYYIWGQARYGTTLGKRVFRIRVVNAADGKPMTYKQSTGRFFAYLASYATLGCGYLMAAFHPRKQALHDILAGTLSVIDPPREKPAA